jgi:hypothetical protein
MFGDNFSKIKDIGLLIYILLENKDIDSIFYDDFIFFAADKVILEEITDDYK